MVSQQKIWDNIAEEWFEFKQKPSENAKEFLSHQKGKVIDLGSGAGRNLMKIKDGKMYIVDFSSEMIKLSRKKAKEQKIEAEFKVSEISKIPYENESFDGGICFDSLHCVETEKQREQTAKELFRVLKPDSQALISVWNKDSKRFKNASKEKFIGWRDKGKRYYYLYDEKEIHDLFRKIGFKIKEKISHNLKIEFVVEKS